MKIVTEVIVEYLGSNRRLIVPALGVFMVKDTGELVFSDLLRNDDGVLVSLLRDRGMSEMEVAVTIDRFVFEVRNELERYGYCRLDEVGILRVEPENGVLRLYPPVKSEEVPLDVQTPYIPEPILAGGGDMLDAMPATQSDEATVGLEAEEPVEADVELQFEETEMQPEEVSQPEEIVAQPEEEVQSEESEAQPEEAVEQSEAFELQPEAVMMKPGLEPEPESEPEPLVQSEKVFSQPKKAKRRIKFDLVMLIAIAVILAAVALIALGIYNVVVSGNSDDSADDRAMDQARVKTEQVK